MDNKLKCERCSTEVVFEADKLASEAVGGGGEGVEENARKKRKEMLKDMLARLEVSERVREGE